MTRLSLLSSLVLLAACAIDDEPETAARDGLLLLDPCTRATIGSIDLETSVFRFDDGATYTPDLVVHIDVLTRARCASSRSEPPTRNAAETAYLIAGTTCGGYCDTINCVQACHLKEPKAGLIDPLVY